MELASSFSNTIPNYLAFLQPGVVITSHENSTPNKDTFQFLGISCLQKVGQYQLEFELLPHPPSRDSLKVIVQIIVTAGSPTQVEVEVGDISRSQI